MGVVAVNVVTPLRLIVSHALGNYIPLRFYPIDYSKTFQEVGKDLKKLNSVLWYTSASSPDQLL